MDIRCTPGQSGIRAAIPETNIPLLTSIYHTLPVNAHARCAPLAQGGIVPTQPERHALNQFKEALRNHDRDPYALPMMSFAIQFRRAEAGACHKARPGKGKQKGDLCSPVHLRDGAHM